MIPFPVVVIGLLLVAPVVIAEDARDDVELQATDIIN